MKFAPQISPPLSYNNFLQVQSKEHLSWKFPFVENSLVWVDCLNFSQENRKHGRTFCKETKNFFTKKKKQKTFYKNLNREMTTWKILFVRQIFITGCTEGNAWHLMWVCPAKSPTVRPLPTSQQHILFWRNLTEDFKPLVFDFIIIATLFSCLILDAQYLPLNFSL